MINDNITNIHNGLDTKYPNVSGIACEITLWHLYLTTSRNLVFIILNYRYSVTYLNFATIVYPFLI